MGFYHCFALLPFVTLSAVSVVWQAGAPILEPGAPGTFDEVAVKDPSIVFAEGQWHLFYTAGSKDAYGLGYVAAPTIEGFSKALRHHLAQLGGASDAYAAAPQVFYFTPQRKWYLVYQTRDTNYQPVYATTENLADPASWAGPLPLVAKNESAKWIDFWVICDDTHAYLFYTRSHQAVYAMRSPLDAFPQGLANPHEIFAPVHESVHVYRVKGRPEYHMLYECRDSRDLRRYGLAAAASLDGPWKHVTGDYASGEMLRFEPGVTPWTAEVSHGEVLRSGHDERLEYDAAETRFLIQGLSAAQHQGAYTDLPWRLGILRREAPDLRGVPETR